MNKTILTALLPVFLASCAIPDQIARHQYANAYQQPDYYIQMYQQKISGQTVEELAKDGALENQARMKGQSRLKLDEFTTAENVYAKGNAVIFDYSLSDKWRSLSEADQTKTKARMTKDLIYRTCSLKTVKLAQEKGLEEQHNYYQTYPKDLSFTLKTNKQICINNGFN